MLDTKIKGAFKEACNRMSDGVYSLEYHLKGDEKALKILKKIRNLQAKLYWHIDG